MSEIGAWDALFDWRVPIATEEQLAEGNVILTHEFGNQHTLSKITTAFVSRAVLLAKRLNKPIVCQHPGEKIAEAMGIRPFAVISKRVRPGTYLDTEEVDWQFADICKQRGWNLVIPFADILHIWRVCHNLKHHGLTPLNPGTQFVFDPQLVLQRPLLGIPPLFLLREAYARNMYRNNGWLA